MKHDYKRADVNNIRTRMWPVSVYHHKVPDNDLLKETVIPYIKETKDSLNVPTGWFTNKVITSHNTSGIEEELKQISELKNQYMEVFDVFFDKQYSLQVNGLWYNYYVDGEWQEEHNHFSGPHSLHNNHFSCIHFLSYNKELHNPVSFIDPLAVTRAAAFEMNSANYSRHINPTIDEGDFLMFPSYLPHEVKSGKPTPDYPRISISFNIEVLKYG